jgi:carboxypeptidase C (cathepsin A)
LRDTDRITERRYEAGHMMYVHRPSRERLRADLESFLRAEDG